MFRFLDEVNDEIAREERLLAVATERDFNYYSDGGSLVLRGPKGKKILVKQTRYVDESGRRKSEEFVIGAVDSEAAIDCVAQEYNEELKKRLQTNLKDLRQLSGRFKPFDVDSIANGLSEAAQSIVMQFPNSASMQTALGLSEQNMSGASVVPARYERGRNVNGASEITVKSGQLVRSKSEAIICTLLNQHSVKFVYENRLELKDENGFKTIRVPDFTITTKRGLVIWEHLGMLDNDEYFDKNADKLRLYWMNGFILNENLIVTVDERGGGINARTIDNIIRKNIAPYV